MNHSRVYGLNPIVGEDPRILILGTFPSEVSRKAKEYYANPKNRFWYIIKHIFNGGEDFYYYHAGVRCLMNNHIAVWDIFNSKIDNGNSANKLITNPEDNDIASFLSQHPTIKRIVFNGSDINYTLVCSRQKIPASMCVFAKQTSSRYYSSMKECLDSWISALTEW